MHCALKIYQNFCGNIKKSFIFFLFIFYYIAFYFIALVHLIVLLFKIIIKSTIYISL